MHTANEPTEGVRLTVVRVVDVNDQTTASSATIDIEYVNDAPIIQYGEDEPRTIKFTEAEGSDEPTGVALLSENVAVSDSDSKLLRSLTFEMSGIADGGGRGGPPQGF